DGSIAVVGDGVLEERLRGRFEWLPSVRIETKEPCRMSPDLRPDCLQHVRKLSGFLVCWITRDDEFVEVRVVGDRAIGVHRPWVIAMFASDGDAGRIDGVCLNGIHRIGLRPDANGRVKEEHTVLPVLSGAVVVFVRITSEENQPPALAVERAATMVLSKE